MNKVVIVTGASRGIGAATALLLAQEGYSVCVNYLNCQIQAEALADEIIANGGRAIAYMADASDEDDVKSLFNATRQAFGAVTHLVNNVGVLTRQSTLVDIELDRFNHIMQTNVNSCFLCCKAFIQQCENEGAIVNVSSLAAKSGAPFEYIGKKKKVLNDKMKALTKGLAQELAERGIRVNGVRPGFIETEIHAAGGEPGRVARLAPTIPLQRGGTPDEVAQAISWLLSDAASYVTGSFIDIAGGR